MKSTTPLSCKNLDINMNMFSLLLMYNVEWVLYTGISVSNQLGSPSDGNHFESATNRKKLTTNDPSPKFHSLSH